MNGQPNGSISASGMPSSQTASSASSTAAALKTSSFAAQRATLFRMRESVPYSAG